MKYKHIPQPTLEEGQEARELHKMSDDKTIFIRGWEVGHWEEVENEVENDEPEPRKEWVKDYEAWTLTPEQEAEWQYQQEHQTPTIVDRIEAQTTYTALMTDTLLEDE